MTTGNQIEAKKIARVLVEEKLAGCVNFYPVTSVYRWQNEICEDAEWQLVIKTDEQLFRLCQLEFKIYIPMMCQKLLLYR